MADELATHVADIDIYHTDRDKSAYNRGLFWHTYHYGDADIATHRTYPVAGKGHIHGGGPSSDQNYTSGLMLHYFLTGDEMSRQTVINLGHFVLGMDDGTKTVFRWLDRGDTGRAIQSAIGYFGPGTRPGEFSQCADRRAPPEWRCRVPAQGRAVGAPCRSSVTGHRGTSARRAGAALVLHDVSAVAGQVPALPRRAPSG
jgi:hypothetical protein